MDSTARLVLKDSTGASLQPSCCIVPDKKEYSCILLLLKCIPLKYALINMALFFALWNTGSYAIAKNDNQ
jgi:hypothetical protein